MAPLTQEELEMLNNLLKYRDRYEIDIQFWPDQTACFINKGGVKLQSYGGDFNFAIGASLNYLNRINKKNDPI